MYHDQILCKNNNGLCISFDITNSSFIVQYKHTDEKKNHTLQQHQQNLQMCSDQLIKNLLQFRLAAK